MCSRIATTAASVTAALATSPPMPALTAAHNNNSVPGSGTVANVTVATDPPTTAVTLHVQRNHYNPNGVSKYIQRADMQVLFNSVTVLFPFS